MMKAIQVSNYGSLQNLSLDLNVPKPISQDIPKNKVLIRTEAVALAPGDARVLSGKTKELQGPPSMPYIPGGDCCGTIVDLGNHKRKASSSLKVGDRIACRFVDGPRGALAEYAIVSTEMCSVVPENLSSNEAAALASSATVALTLSKRFESNSKERVLILGAGGGVGSHLVQILKMKGLYVVGISDDPGRLKSSPLFCDDALDYNQINPFEVEEWKKNPFDTIVDLGAGGWLRLLEQKEKDSSKRSIIKSAKNGGRFLTLSQDTAWYEAHSIFQALKLFLFTPLWRAVYSRLWWNKSHYPKFTFAMSLDTDPELMKETLNLASEGKLKACIDERGPFSFDTDGVRDAFALQESHHCKGKVVINILN